MVSTSFGAMCYASMLLMIRRKYSVDLMIIGDKNY